MGRRNTLVLGKTFGNFTITGALPKYEGSNRLIQVTCNTCGTERECWNTSFRTGRVSCRTCSGTLSKKTEAGQLYPYLVVHSTHVDIIYPPQLPPKGGNVYLVVSSSSAVPYTVPESSTLLPDVIPEPDSGYLYHLKVPAEWVDFYCDLGDLPDSHIERALAFYAEHVEQPTAHSYSQNLKGSGTTWLVDGQRYAYIYWQDRNTWPKSYPAPVKAEKPVQAKLPSSEPPEFPSLGVDPIRKDHKPPPDYLGSPNPPEALK